jgi:hypothetical protein
VISCLKAHEVDETKRTYEKTFVLICTLFTGQNPVRRVIFMRYSYEFKKKAVELYRQGQWMETPEGVKQNTFRHKIREWHRRENAQGPEAYKHKNRMRN